MPFKSREAQLKYMAEYRKKNKRKLVNKRNRRVQCACSAICNWNSLSRHRKTKFHMNFEEKTGGKTIKDFKEINTCMVIESDDEDEKPEGEKPQTEGEKPVWKKFCKKCGNMIETHSIKRLITCELLDNSKTIEFLKKNIQI